MADDREEQDGRNDVLFERQEHDVGDYEDQCGTCEQLLRMCRHCCISYCPADENHDKCGNHDLGRTSGEGLTALGYGTTRKIHPMTSEADEEES